MFVGQNLLFHMGAMLTALYHSRNFPPCKRRQRFCRYVCTPDRGCTGDNRDIDAGTDTDFVGACTAALMCKVPQLAVLVCHYYSDIQNSICKFGREIIPLRGNFFVLKDSCILGRNTMPIGKHRRFGGPDDLESSSKP